MSFYCMYLLEFKKMIKSHIFRQIADLSSKTRLTRINFPARQRWTPVVPEAPVIETEFGQGCVLWFAVGFSDWTAI